MPANNQFNSTQMKAAEEKSENLSSSRAYFEEQCARVRSGDYWNCLVAARELSALLLAEGRSPWIARLRKTEIVGGESFHHPLIPRGLGVSATWTTHYVCCCDGMSYDPVAGKPIPFEAYSLEVFGEQIPREVFVPARELPAYLSGNRLL
jgi:hypothetical protein